MSNQNIILIVDDNETIRMLVKFSIQPMGYDVREAISGLDGLSKYEELERAGTPPILIISDVSMPDMDGLEFIETLRSFNELIPVIFLTAHSDQGSRNKGRDMGANAWVVKPFVAESIRRTIVEVLDKANEDKVKLQGKS